MRRISLDGEAYRLLEDHKLGPRDSFSSVVKRHLGNEVGLRASAGGWEDVPPERTARIERKRVDVFGTTDDPA